MPDDSGADSDSGAAKKGAGRRRAGAAAGGRRRAGGGGARGGAAKPQPQRRRQQQLWQPAPVGALASAASLPLLPSYGGPFLAQAPQASPLLGLQRNASAPAGGLGVGLVGDVLQGIDWEYESEVLYGLGADMQVGGWSRVGCGARARWGACAGV